MGVKIEDVLAELDAIEPDYQRARQLGVAALPHLSVLVKGSESNLAAKAVYLASLIGTEAATDVLRTSMACADPIIRLQTASGARHLAPTAATIFLQSLLNDPDHGVRKVALRSSQQLFTTATMPEGMRTRIARLADADPELFVRSLAKSIGARP